MFMGDFELTFRVRTRRGMYKAGSLGWILQRKAEEELSEEKPQD